MKPTSTIGQRFSVVVGLVAIGVGTALAGQRSWMADDTFISLRYAANLAQGDGLVYNVGERVEGFTNLLWTLMLAVALRLGIDAEVASMLGGLLSFTLLLGVLLRAHLGAREAAGINAFTLPVGVLLAVGSSAMLDFATSGLETAFFSLLLVAGLRAADLERPVGAAVLLALATLCRPDGLLVAAIAGLSLLLRNRRHALRYGLVLALILAPVTLARVHYYGDLLPNTFYAKSGDRSWWSQGLVYLGLHLREHPWLLLLPVTVRSAPLPAVAALAYGLYVVKVGGDFMLGRLLVPATAMAALPVDVLSLRLQARGLRGVIAAASLVLLMALLPPSVGAGATVSGIMNERLYYSPETLERCERDLATLRRYTDGLPLTVVIDGAQARMAYRADWPVVVEGAAGLTDATIAHQPLLTRGRVGHEKKATIGYLILQRRVDLTFGAGLEASLDLDTWIPRVEAGLGGVWSRMLRWSFPVADALKARGARITNYPALLAADGEGLAQLTDEEAKALYRKHWLFYFASADDERESPFKARLPGYDVAADVRARAPTLGAPATAGARAPLP